MASFEWRVAREEQRVLVTMFSLAKMQESMMIVQTIRMLQSDEKR